MKVNSTTPVVNNVNVNNHNKQIAFKGVSDFLNLKRQGPMGRGLFITTAFTFLLGSRLITSRDKDEKREILIRDVPTIIIAVMGVPVIGKFVAKAVEKSSGFAILDKTSKDVFSYGQIDNDLYRFDKNSASGFKGFCKTLSEAGGDLKKIFSNLGKNVKNQLDVEKFSQGNESFIKELMKDKKLSKMLKEELSKADNAVLKQAGFLKSIPTFAGFAATLGLVGVLIPNLNIHITESISKKRLLEKQNGTSPTEAKLDKVAKKD